MLLEVSALFDPRCSTSVWMWRQRESLKGLVDVVAADPRDFVELAVGEADEDLAGVVGGLWSRWSGRCRVGLAVLLS
ncbi:hypothetical protein [Streptomyces sp. NPDC056632]|uniref:hypothetical protein n=1 Tax=Streptomyces sp. NPDC056632 TaxID=3345884 RepID=UPI0036AF9C81